MRPPERAQAPDALTLAAAGDLELRGRLPWSSNATFLVDVRLPNQSMLAVYKPLRGERRLWDYPPGLYRREVAAYRLSEALGWGLVPETVPREGPLGVGSVQRFVDADFSQHYFTLLERPEHHAALRAVCLFDVLANNGDRKSGHCLLGEDGRVWAIDHGLSFHSVPKLRTVIWEFAGQRCPDHLMADVARLAAEVPAPVTQVLEGTETDALRARAAALVAHPVFPHPRSARAYPWPLV